MDMRSDEQADFLDVHALLESSQPHPRTGWLGYAVGIFLLVVLTSAYLSARSPQWRAAVDVVSSILLIALMGAMTLLMGMAVRRQRAEVRRTEALEEMVQLRRWPEALALAREILSQPTRTPQARAQVLILLSSIFARYQRFEDTIAIHNHLLETINFDDMTAHGIRLGRAMAMLREDHLVDADAAIGELRRMSQGRKSAGLALVELYRDVKTGHPAEAIEHFDEALPGFRQQLGHRTGDAYALLAKAFDMVDRPADAQAAYEKATLLSAPVELKRRYPEIASLSDKYRAANIPAELGAAA